jgi:hypothetical protein
VMQTPAAMLEQHAAGMRRVLVQSLLGLLARPRVLAAAAAAAAECVRVCRGTLLDNQWMCLCTEMCVASHGMSFACKTAKESRSVQAGLYECAGRVHSWFSVYFVSGKMM